MSDSPPAVQGLAGADFPLQTFEEAARDLRRPFTPEAIKHKVQATFGNAALIVPYIDARLVIERLNLVIPQHWAAEYRREGKLLWCDLTIDGITRSDVGENYQGKGLISDSLKRSAVHFGVAVSLYAIPKIVLEESDGHVKKKKVAKKDTLVLTPNGETRCRDLYDAWLDTIGRKKFGEPLDHGDAQDAIGDPDAEAPPATADSDAPSEPAQDEPLTDAKAQALVAAAEGLYKNLPTAAKSKMPKAAFTRALAGASTSHKDLEALVADLEKRGGGDA